MCTNHGNLGIVGEHFKGDRWFEAPLFPHVFHEKPPCVLVGPDGVLFPALSITKVRFEPMLQIAK